MRLLSDDQNKAIEKLKKLKVGALFMGCGTGKTQTAVSLINSTDEIDLLIWIAPLSTIPNLKDEIALCDCRYSPVFYGVESIGQSDRVFQEIMELINTSKNSFMVVDESLKIKNLRAKRTRRIIQIGKMATYKLILNGTPITKNILDIYPQMLFLSPKILQKDFYRFRDDYCIYKQKKRGHRVLNTYVTGYANVDHLLNLIEPYVYECSLDMPLTKNYRTVYWHMTADERLNYGLLKECLIQQSIDRSDTDLLGIFQKLQHSYCLADDKLERLNAVIDDESIVFCKFITSAERLKELYPNNLILTYGKNSFGLNLQDYSKIIYFDKTFDYAFREQSEARIYRRGQESDCEYIDMTGDVGLESLIDSCISRKMSLIEAFKNKGNKLEEL
jgi:SNF2 family DNA or RNA helicase